MLWLILARGLSGIGGGGIVNSVWVITTEIVPPGTQAKWSQALSVTWSASAIAGPILGGLFTGELRGSKNNQIPISDMNMCRFRTSILALGLSVQLKGAGVASWFTYLFTSPL
jgi:MFS family permease